MTPQELMDLLEAAGLSTRQYSGRGTSGKFCPAFTVTSVRSMPAAGFTIAHFAQRAGEDCEEEVADAVASAQIDGKIVYFPRYTVEAVTK